MKNNLKNIGIVLFIIITIIITILIFTGQINLWTKGMASVSGNTKKFTDINSHVIEGEYYVLIDLNDLESNKGKVLYNNGKSKIYVSSVDNTGSTINGGYRIHFRACGQYSLNYAELISGVQHVTVGENLFSTDMSSQLTAKYKDKVFNCNLMGMTGISFKDGDLFSFYIFPSEAYDNNEVSFEEKGVVHLTITNLYKNIWTKK